MLIYCHLDSQRLPDKLAQRFTDGLVASVYSMALGAEKSYFMSYRNKDGKDYICMFFLDIAHSTQVVV
jgi:hypothetical protein